MMVLAIQAAHIASKYQTKVTDSKYQRKEGDSGSDIEDHPASELSNTSSKIKVSAHMFLLGFIYKLND